MATTEVGTPGTSATRTGAEAMDAAPVPTPLVAATVKL